MPTAKPLQEIKNSQTHQAVQIQTEALLFTFSHLADTFTQSVLQVRYRDKSGAEDTEECDFIAFKLEAAD